MTREDIAHMAIESGLEDWSVHGRVESKWACLEHFAGLAAAAERERICQLLGVLPITNDDLRLIRDVIRGEGAK